jgi:hypothetical protein
MTREEKLSIIDRFEKAYGAVDGLVESAPDEALAFVPPIEAAWSVNDQLVHLLDAEANLCYRIRGAVAEPGAAVPVWDEEAWQTRLRYGKSDGRRCLALAEGLRAFYAGGLRALLDEDWAAYQVRHPTRGILSLEAILEMYRDHVAFHLRLIKRNLDAWKARKGT